MPANSPCPMNVSFSDKHFLQRLRSARDNQTHGYRQRNAAGNRAIALFGDLNRQLDGKLETAEPLPNSDSISILPPISCTRDDAIESPRPVPSCLRVAEPSTWQNLSNMFLQDDLVRYAYSRIFNAKLSAMQFAGPRSTGHGNRYFNKHMATVGKLDRVTCKIGQDLALSGQHRPNTNWAVRATTRTMVSTSCFTSREETKVATSSTMSLKAEPLWRQCHLPGVNFGKIENIVDYRKQRLSRNDI